MFGPSKLRFEITQTKKTPSHTCLSSVNIAIIIRDLERIRTPTLSETEI